MAVALDAFRPRSDPTTWEDGDWKRASWGQSPMWWGQHHQHMWASWFGKKPSDIQLQMQSQQMQAALSASIAPPAFVLANPSNQPKKIKGKHSTIFNAKQANWDYTTENDHKIKCQKSLLKNTTKIWIFKGANYPCWSVMYKIHHYLGPDYFGKTFCSHNLLSLITKQILVLTSYYVFKYFYTKNKNTKVTVFSMLRLYKIQKTGSKVKSIASFAITSENMK